MASKGRGIFLLRIVLGWGFLFAGLDKLFALGGTPFSAAGFLKFATGGSWPGVDAKTIVNPTHGFWVSLGGNASLIPIINTLVVFGEIAIGVALILGIATRFSGLMGFVLAGMLALASWDFQNGFVNEQVLYAVASLSFLLVGAGAYALDNIAVRLPITQRVPGLKYLVS